MAGATVSEINAKEVQNSYYKKYEYDSKYTTLGGILFLGAIITVVWEFFDVAKTTREYNNQLYKNIFGQESPLKTNLNPRRKGQDLNK